MHNFVVFVISLAAVASKTVLAQGNTCPDGTGPSTENGVPVCCPGNLFSYNGDASCIICADGSSSACTTIPITASDYTSLVYGQGATASGSPDGTAVASGSPGSTGALGSSASATASSQIVGGLATTSSLSVAATGSGASTSASTSRSKGAAPAVTEAPFLVFAGALAGLAFL